MNKYLKRSMVILFATVFCMSILSGCSKKEEAVLPDLPEEEYYDDEYYEEEFVEDDLDEEYYEDEDYAEEPEEEVKETADTKEAGDVSCVGKWYTEDYDETENWANSYCLELKEDGTAICQGYRNRDSGKYEVKGPDKVLITFDFCETDEPDAGWVAAEGYKYTIDMTINGDDATIKIDAPDVSSNLTDGAMHRK